MAIVCKEAIDQEGNKAFEVYSDKGLKIKDKNAMFIIISEKSYVMDAAEARNFVEVEE